MPLIRISETDATGKVQSSAISNTVFVPIVSTNTAFGPELFTKTSEFSAYLTAQDVQIDNANMLGRNLCMHLLNLGFEVLVQCINGSEQTQLTSTQWAALEDKALYDIRFITNGALKNTGALQSQATTALNRGDCTALLCLDEKTDGTESFSYVASEVVGAFKAAVANGRQYAAGFTPWFTSTNDDLIKDITSGTEAVASVLVPASFAYLFAYANATQNNPEWYAIAGFQRGIIPELSNVNNNYTTADINILQARTELDESADNVGVAINPIAYIRPAGYIIYGNRTLKENDATKKTTATSFLNVRNGVSAIKKVMYEAARKYTFEQNNEALWVNFQSYVTPLLERMKSGNGLLGYKFVKLKTDAKARLAARLNIVPVEAVEDFDLEVYMTDDTTTVGE